MKITIRVTDNGRTGVVRKSTDGNFTAGQVAAWTKDALDQVGATFAKPKKASKKTSSNK